MRKTDTIKETGEVITRNVEGDYLNDKNLRVRKNRMRGNAPYRKPESIMKKKKKKS